MIQLKWVQAWLWEHPKFNNLNIYNKITMALLDLLKKSTLGLGGKTPSQFAPTAASSTDLVQSLRSSQLDLDGKSPVSYTDISATGGNLVQSLKSSTLDLDDKTPEKYLDNLPK